MFPSNPCFFRKQGFFECPGASALSHNELIINEKGLILVEQSFQNLGLLPHIARSGQLSNKWLVDLRAFSELPV